ncbi:MAG: HIT family protein [Roseiflexaceae bacterium]|nr:HIT family protein [Roseiflexaceae bacterium]
MHTQCPFCDPLMWQRESIGIENALCLFITRPEPVLAGSGLIIPRAHRPTAFDLTAEEWQASYEILTRVKAQLDRTLAPQGYTLGWNVGAVGGQEVFHAHMHVIPRFADEPYAGRGLRWWLKQEQNRRQPKSQ